MVDLKDSEELQSLTASLSPTPSYDATRTRTLFTNVQIDLLPGYDDPPPSRESSASTSISCGSHRPSHLFRSRGKDNDCTCTSVRSSPRGSGSFKGSPGFSYYSNDRGGGGGGITIASPRSSSESCFDDSFSNCTGVKHIYTDEDRVLSKSSKHIIDQSTQTMTLGTRHRMECDVDYHYFSLQEDFDYNAIHVQKSFAPTNLFGMPVLLRWFLCYVTYAVIRSDYHDAIHHKESNIIVYFSHLTNITLVVSLCYQALSSFLSILAIVRSKHDIILYQPQIEVKNMQKGQIRPGAFVCLTWLLYSISLPCEFVVAIGYWSLDYNPDIPMTFVNFYKHAMIGFFILIDGLILGRIPLRAKHWKGVFIYGILYLLWSLVYSYYKMGKHHGVIYAFIDWRGNPHQAAAVFFLLLFVMAPIVFYICWLISAVDGICICCPGFCSFNGQRRHIHLQKEILPTCTKQPSRSIMSRAIDDDIHLPPKTERFDISDIVILECEKGLSMRESNISGFIYDE